MRSLNLDFLLRPTRAKIDRANLDYYQNCTQRNLDRAIREIDAAANAPSQWEAKSKLRDWMENKLHGQSLIVGYYENCCIVLAEIEKLVMQLKEEHYPPIGMLGTSLLQRDELHVFLRQVHGESIALANKYLGHIDD